jgi:hypothetical protein
MNNYVMNKLPLSLFHLMVITLIALSCSQADMSKNAKKLDGFKHLSIIVNSHDGCYEEITLNDSGIGRYVYGFRRLTKDSIIGEKTLTIKSDSAAGEIGQAISVVKKRSPVILPEMARDAFQYILIVDDIKCIERYGNDTLLNKVLFNLEPFIPHAKGFDCGVFTLVRQIKK